MAKAVSICLIFSLVIAKKKGILNKNKWFWSHFNILFHAIIHWYWGTTICIEYGITYWVCGGSEKQKLLDIETNVRFGNGSWQTYSALTKRYDDLSSNRENVTGIILTSILQATLEYPLSHFCRILLLQSGLFYWTSEWKFKIVHTKCALFIFFFKKKCLIHEHILKSVWFGIAI